MGTINYGTSKYITMGIDPYDFEQVKNCIIEELQEDQEDVTPDDISDQEVYDRIESYYDADRENAEYYLNELNLNTGNFSVKLNPGYYEGLYISIDYDNLYFYDQDEKDETIRDVKKIIDLLKNLAGIRFQACYPFWYTTFKSYEETLKEIETAYNDMISDINNTPIED